MSIDLVDPATGAPPVGRASATEADVYNAFVGHAALSGSSTRPMIWNEYELARDLLRGSVRVHAAWLGGGFTTSNLDPSDIDVTFIVNGRDLINASDQDKLIVESFMPLPRPPFGNIERTHPFGLVDSYVLLWRPFADPQPHLNPDAREYFQQRGYWDDFWQRQRSGPKGAPPAVADALPVRGYVEVILDAFAR